MQGVADDERRMTIVEHLEELRRVLIISAAAWLIATAVAFIFRNQIFDILLHPILPTLRNVHNGNAGRVQVLNPLEPLTVALRLVGAARTLGFTIAMVTEVVALTPAEFFTLATMLWFPACVHV